MKKKKVIDLTKKQKDKYCKAVKECKDCPLNKTPDGPYCVKDQDIKKEIAFYKKYVAQLEKIGNVEVEI